MDSNVVPVLWRERRHAGMIGFMTATPFFTPDGDLFQPTDVCRGPWDHNSLHGRVIAALMAHDIETKYIDPAFHPSRLTVDLYRMPPFAPVKVESHVVRDGNRIRIVDSEFSSEGVSLARASCVLLRRTDNPEGRVWSEPDWDAPAPETIEPAPPPANGRDPMWESRTIGDRGFGTHSQRRMWMREVRPLITGVELTPFLRAASACDFSNPFANSSDQGLQFVNVDITLYLHRLPVGEWVGFEVASHHSAEGIAVGECAMYDTTGAIGRSSCAGLAQRRSASITPPPARA